MRWAIYLDMDAFYLSCEARRRPEIRGRPAVVAHDPAGGKGRGVVLSASYEARKHGFRSAMPVREAWRLGQEVLWIPPDFPYYEATSREVMALLRQRSPAARQFSIDEAALPWDGEDASGAEAEGRAIQDEIRNRLGLPCSVGIGPSILLAKMASDRAKPGGLVVISPGDVAEFVGSLPVRAVPGVGAVTERDLGAVGVRRVGDCLAVPGPALRRAVGPLAGLLRDLARGRWEEEPWPEESEPKSLGAMSTFSEDTSDPEELTRTLRRFLDDLERTLKHQGYAYRTVTLRIRFADFHALQRSRSLPHHTHETRSALGVATTLLREILHPDPAHPKRPVRTVGLTLGDLKPWAGGQKDLSSFARETDGSQAPLPDP